MIVQLVGGVEAHSLLSKVSTQMRPRTITVSYLVSNQQSLKLRRVVL